MAAEFPIPVIVGSVVILILSLGIHEAAHGWVALKCGDTTARDMGRITVNPIVHIDPFMTIILPVLCYLSMGIPFGGAKPVPVNFYNLRKPYRDMALVALAGPVSNFLIAILLVFIRKVVVLKYHWLQEGLAGDVILALGLRLNLLLAAFNLLPIPPLDGSRVMAWLLPEDLRPPYMRLESFGLLLVLGFVFFVPGGYSLVWGMMNTMLEWVEAIVSLGDRW
jgi:Zn-dependent protease